MQGTFGTENRRVTSQNEMPADRNSPWTPVDMPRTEKPPRLPPQFELVTLGRTPSAVDVALARAAEGAGEGTLVRAREQTNARTRRGKAWIGYGGNLHCALVIEPDYPNEESWQLLYVNALAVGSAMAEMVSPMTGLRFAWPNRLLVNDLLAARLDIAVTEPARDPYPALVLGASVNIAMHPPQPEPEEYNSIHASGEREITVGNVLEAYASHFLSWSGRWADEGFEPIRRAWRIRADGLGSDAEIRLLDGSIAGRVDDVDEHGALVLDTASGRRRITIGEYFGLDAAPAD